MQTNDKNTKRKPRGLRSDGRVQVTLDIGRNPDGSPKRKSFYGKSRTEAERKRDEYKVKLAMGLTADSDMTVEKWIDKYMQLYRANVNPIYLKRDSVPYNRLKRALGRRKLSSIREADLQNELNSLTGMSKSTIEAYRQTICRVFEKARKNKLIPDNPASDLIVPNGTKGTHRAIERWESDCILSNWRFHRCGIWAMLMLLCGLRRGEMMALRWENVDMNNRQITVREVAVIDSNKSIIEERTKTISGLRILPICSQLWDALNTTPQEERTGLVCLTAGGEQITGSAFKRGWAGFNLAMQRILNGEDLQQQGRRETLESRMEDARKAGREYVIFNVRAHDLRHTFATALYDAGVPVKAAQYYLGHADIRMTLDLYTHLSAEREKDSSSKLVTFLDAWLDNSNIQPAKIIWLQDGTDGTGTQGTDR